MNEIGDALGTVAEGALLARAVEPRAGEAEQAGHTHESACLNCGTVLVGPHCHGCGQRAHVHRTIGAFAHDLLHGVFHFEGKTWRTLPLLAWQPGRLTREYIDGRRASYVSPIALFLFVVFLSFAAFNMLGAGDKLDVEKTTLAPARASFAQNAKKIAALREEQRALTPAQADRGREIARQIQGLENDQDGLQLVLGKNAADSRKDTTKRSAEDQLPPALANAIDHVRANPQLAIYKAQSNAYKYSWALIPLSVPFVWLLFPFSRRFGAYDHTVFATYSITFMIALAAVSSLLFYAGQGWIGGLLLLYAPLHMYRQLRGTYRLSRFGALWRMLVLSLFAWVAILLFVSLIAALLA